MPGANIEDGPVSLSVFVYDQAGHQSVAVTQTMEHVVGGNQGDVAAALDWWVLLEPRQLFGTVVNIHRSGFDFLKKPGTYKLYVKLRSVGGYPPSITDRLANSQPNAPEVPYNIWSGTASWESNWLRVVK
jgi:hypothetical protein